MPLLQIFRKDRKHWQQHQIEEVQLFFMLNPFFNRYYEHQDFDNVVSLTFYTKLDASAQLLLQINKKSDAVILLSGKIQIYRKAFGKQLRKAKRSQKQTIHESYIKMGQYHSQSELIEVNGDAIVKSGEENISEVLFVPTLLYQQYAQRVRNRRLQTVLQVLSEVVGAAPRGDLRRLADSGCSFKQFKMNNYIYRAGSIPEFCYIVIFGNIKIQSPGYSARSMMDTAIIGEDSIFGDNDLSLPARTQNAICCSAHSRILQIGRQPYHQFVTKNQQLLHPLSREHKQIRSKRTRHNASTLGYSSENIILPRINCFHSIVKEQEEEKIQMQIVQNCHMLIDLTSRKSPSSSFRLPAHTDRDYSVTEFERKLKLFNRRKSKDKPFDLSNKLF